MTALSIENSITPLNASGLQQSDNPLSGSELKQSDFIELLVAQVKNQDPSKPLDPSQFMNQLAQFSTVNGVQELKTSFDSLAGKLSSDQSIRAAGLVGRTVLVPGGDAVLNGSDPVSGLIEMPQSSSGVTLKVLNGFGELVRSLPLGPQQGGRVQFQWDGFNDGGVPAATGSYELVAEAMIDGSTQAVEISVDTRVDSISLNQELAGTPEATLLNLATGTSIPLSTVQQIR